jgi:hypothetical protein
MKEKENDDDEFEFGFDEYFGELLPEYKFDQMLEELKECVMH